MSLNASSLWEIDCGSEVACGLISLIAEVGAELEIGFNSDVTGVFCGCEIMVIVSLIGGEVGKFLLSNNELGLVGRSMLIIIRENDRLGVTVVDCLRSAMEFVVVAEASFCPNSKKGKMSSRGTPLCKG